MTPKIGFTFIIAGMMFLGYLVIKTFPEFKMMEIKKPFQGAETTNQFSLKNEDKIIEVFTKKERTLRQYLESLNLENNNEIERIVVHFWATWCGPCQSEFPELIKVSQQEHYKKTKFLILAVNDDEKRVRSFIKKILPDTDNIPANLLFVFDTDTSFYKINSSGIPVSIIYDNKLNMTNIFYGPIDWH